MFRIVIAEEICVLIYANGRFIKLKGCLHSHLVLSDR